MLSDKARSGSNSLLVPVGKFLSRLGATPNVLTLLGLTLTCVTAAVLLGQGMWVAGAIVVALSTLFDLLDGAVARVSGRSTAFGAVLDATCDRIADGVIMGSILWWVIGADSYHPLVTAGLIASLVLAQVVSYSKARGDANNLASPSGLMERADRLVVLLLAVGLEGLNVPYALELGVALLAVGSTITVIQRVYGLYVSDKTGTGNG